MGISRRPQIPRYRLQARQEFRDGLYDNAIGKMRLIHGRPKMLEIAGQEMARFRRAGRKEDGLVFVRKTNRNRRRYGLRD